MSWKWRKYGTGADRCGGFLYTSCAPVDTANLSASLQDFLCQLHTNSRILLMLNPSFCVPYSPQNPPVLLTLKSVCLAWGQPLSSVSGRKRYNTLDFAAQNRVPTGCCSPLLETQSQRDCIPLDTPFFFTLRRPNYENAVCHRCEEKQKEASAPGS